MAKSSEDKLYKATTWLTWVMMLAVLLPVLVVVVGLLVLAAIVIF